MKYEILKMMMMMMMMQITSLYVRNEILTTGIDERNNLINGSLTTCTNKTRHIEMDPMVSC